MPDSEKLLTQLSAAVSFFYKDDAICPGVVISTLKNGLVYASVVRYNPAWHAHKKVVCHVSQTNLSEALNSLSRLFVEHTNQSKTPTNPLDALKATVANKRPVGLD